MKKVIVLLTIIISIAACSTKLIMPGEGEQLVQSEAASNGQEVFMESCNRCHPAGNAGLGPSIINKPLPGFIIKKQVRKGLGAMPSFDKEHLTDEELDNIIVYIKKIR